MVIDNKS